MGPLPLVLVPIAFAALAWSWRDNRTRPRLLAVAGVAQLCLALVAAARPAAAVPGNWLRVDPLAALAALAVALLFACCSLYAPGYLAIRKERPNRRWCGGLLLMVAMLNLVACAQHLGLLWVALEATTLASAPLLYFNQTPNALEAAWKYLLLGSVGIALALLGSLFLGYAALKGGEQASLLLDELVAAAPQLSKPWLHAAFVTLLVGYGTKMGLAPMHTWKPDAYGEAPGVLGAMLAGGVTSAAFVAILRLCAVTHAAGEVAFTQPILIGMGLLSMLFGAVFMVRQKDIKRMLAYSSVEHMGILVLGAGIGGVGLFGALLHLLNNALGKGVLFLATGNIHRAYDSKNTDVVRGALLRVPGSAWLFLLGFLAITGSPPFGPFVSEFTIVRAAFASGHALAAALFLLLMLAVFLGMGSTVLLAVQGEPPPPVPGAVGESPRMLLPVLALLLLVLLLGVWLPPPLVSLLQAAAGVVEGVRP